MQYEISGGVFPVVTCHLQGGESMITESGSMVWMTPNITMQTTGGGLDRIFSRAFSGESLFQNIYTAQGDGTIAFGASFPGRIMPIQISPGYDMILQKKSFLASEMGVELSVHINQRIGTGFFGGEGFIMQRLSGQGTAFLEFDGHVVEYDLQPGQQIVVDTGYLAAMDGSCDIEIKTVPGIKNMVFGGEGVFNTVVTGPGRVWLQTMPISNVAQLILSFMPPKS